MITGSLSESVCRQELFGVPYCRFVNQITISYGYNLLAAPVAV